MPICAARPLLISVAYLLLFFASLHFMLMNDYTMFDVYKRGDISMMVIWLCAVHL